MAHAGPNAMMGNIEEAGNNATKGNIGGEAGKNGVPPRKKREAATLHWAAASRIEMYVGSIYSAATGSA